LLDSAVLQDYDTLRDVVVAQFPVVQIVWQSGHVTRKWLTSRHRSASSGNVNDIDAVGSMLCSTGYIHST